MTTSDFDILVICTHFWRIFADHFRCLVNLVGELNYMYESADAVALEVGWKWKCGEGCRRPQKALG